MAVVMHNQLAVFYFTINLGFYLMFWAEAGDFFFNKLCANAWRG